MKVTTHLILFVVCQFICLGQAFSQKRKSEVVEHTKHFLKTYDQQESGQKEILLIGAFHFRNRLYDLNAIENQIIEFNPDALFVEEVPAQSESGYKERYKNELYANAKRGNSFYSDAIDSAVQFTDISRAQAPDLIKEHYEILRKKPKNMDVRVKLINALFINGDDQNAILQIEYLKKILNSDSMPSYEDIKKKFHPYTLNTGFLWEKLNI